MKWHQLIINKYNDDYKARGDDSTRVFISETRAVLEDYVRLEVNSYILGREMNLEDPEIKQDSLLAEQGALL